MNTYGKASVLVTAIACAYAVASCAGSSSDVASGKSSRPAPPATATAPTAVTPVIASTLSTPVAVSATDGKTHIAYELLLTNTMLSPTTIHSVKATAGGRTLFELSGDRLSPWMKNLGTKTPGTVMGPGQAAVVLIDAIVDNMADVPGEISHVLEVELSKPNLPLFPRNLTEHIATIAIDRQRPVVIRPPLDGPHWVNGDGCCGATTHRAAISQLNGRLWAPERYAVDYVQLNDDGLMYTGDRSSPQSYVAFGAKVYSVADGTVVAVNRGLPEQIPEVWPTGLALNDFGGNYAIVDIGSGHYAFYAHLQNGSVKVNVGDRLRAGQVIGLLGNTGNSGGPHLHFHIVDGPDPLASNGVPFEIDSFRLEARIGSDASLDRLIAGGKALYAPNGDVGQRDREMPLTFDVMTYKAGN